MKFDVVVGNPPYQENDNGIREGGAANASARPLYHHFFNMAKTVANEKVNLVFPARWLSGAGRGLGKFMKEMLEDKHIRSMTVYKKSSTVFPNTEIKGGVLYLTHDKNYQGKAQVQVEDTTGEVSRYESYLNSAGSGVFIPFGELVTIYEKVSAKEDLANNSIQTITSSSRPFGLRTDFFRNQKKYNLPPIAEERESETDIEIIGLERGKRVFRYIPEEYPIPYGLEYVDCWKVLTPYAYGSGNFGERPPQLLVGSPKQIVTETFLVMGLFETDFEAEALKKYFQTKFFRALIGILKTTQHSTTTYGLIPLQDFTPNSDVDWTKEVSEIDHQLYRKYELSEEEVDFIERKVKEVD
ncbi:hypothetical protein CJ205_08415 [Dolosicoccus paucivorans]|uniref:Type II methyltransferase M.TaqI-like domain-containing protein n=1 Tax=Dolosicoccus paucivorans TaxID=84521 RepID=A0A2N6SKV7_9LACT|nr:Eco57I restriction-modification methylase domain-containing protein [Dolosicoccus paucivorans]PMC56319.1 hypothetical protein CJ205_08415 [Dolosicoccus paucivorans]